MLSEYHQLSVLLKWLKRLFTPIAVVFFIYAGYISRNILTTIFINSDIRYLVLTIFLWIVIHCTLPIGTVIILKSCNMSVSYIFALRTHIKYLPARYIPGGIWHTVGRIVDFYSHGVRPPYITALFLLEQIFSVGVSLTIGGFSIGYFRGTTNYWGIIGIVSMIVSIIGLALVPFILNHKLLKSHDCLIYRFYILCIGFYSIVWYLLGIAFISYLSAFPIINNEVSALEIGGTYLFSWAIGYLAIFAPQGIGVFELVAGNLINVPISLGSIIVLIAGYRVIMLITDSILWTIYYFMTKQYEK